ncbi:MAG: efflux RND transporter periplasmic adaptor subunit, partial [Bacteroidales bacterium]|nr:efflux RND transporter periplasmic adaptor subunit [Bacteroidales bacterium]
FDGVIGLRGVSVGTYASPSVVVAKLTKISPIKVEFAVPEHYADDVQIGYNVEFTLPGELDKFHAKVYAKESMIDPETHTLKIRALYNNTQGAALAGRYASVNLEKQRIENALTVPSESIVPEMGVDKIYLYKGGKAQPVTVQVGIRTDKDVQIVSGLNKGDTVIVSGTLQLRTGLPVVLDNID